ncbi:hypothetical protein [Streptomyces syringium]|uniref:hypothetical protein n=1 Tax=Streptomyces syringium TaxID=76729 RepID=UPI003AAF545E
MTERTLRFARREDDRRNRLLTVIRAEGGEWPASRVWALYRERQWAPNRTTARKDLQLLARRRHLIERGPQNGRFYTLNYAGGA